LLPLDNKAYIAASGIQWRTRRTLLPVLLLLLLLLLLLPPPGLVFPFGCTHNSS
jgi:hypothetical protein